MKMNSMAAAAACACALAALGGCATTGVTEFRGPDGAEAKTVKCSSDRSKCYAEASRTCSGGSYRAVASESHAGGLLMDIFPGPVTWYTMTYSCGPSDGRFPDFPFGGVAVAMPELPPPPVRTTCTTFGNTTNCTSK